MTGPEAQADYAQSGFRPVVDGVEIGEVEGANDPADPFPAPETLFTIDDDFNGWGEAADKYFGDGEEGNPLGIITALQQETGKVGEEYDRRPARRADESAGPASPEGRRPRRARRSTPRNTLTRGAGLGLGIAMLWFSLLVLIPLAAIVAAASAGGWDGYLGGAAERPDLGSHPAHRHPVAAGDPRQRRDRDRHRLGAGP